MRFAQTEIKLTLVKILSNFMVYPCGPFKHNGLAFTEGIVRRPKNGVWCFFKPRDRLQNFKEFKI